MIKFILIGNRGGKIRLSRFYGTENQKENFVFQQNALKECLKDRKKEGILHFEDFLLVYRLYTNLIFIAGIDDQENELGALEFLQNYVEAIIKYFDNVSEEDLVYNFDRAHMILDEMVMNGFITETNQTRILAPLHLVDSTKK